MPNKPFSQQYAELNENLRNNGSDVPSRNGMTKEVLDAQTIIYPEFSCTGGYKRDMNIFFLLAEALWIWAGRRDVKFLDLFNSRMKNYSDNGKYFHAPYGWRLRKWGVDSDLEYPFIEASEKDDESVHAHSSIDQLYEVAKQLSEDKGSRQAVLSIWNPELDLLTKTLDKPCNDILMYKIRSGKLYATIGNRSNDLHWGLPTNVFQFSVIGKLLSQILEVDYWQQCHNSQSLHYYTDNGISDIMHKEYLKSVANGYEKNNELYGSAYSIYPFDLALYWNRSTPPTIKSKFSEVDFYVNLIINSILFGETEQAEVLREDLKNFSPDLYKIYKLLRVYKGYKEDQDQEGRHKTALSKICSFALHENHNLDITIMAFNFFFVRLQKKIGLPEAIKFIEEEGLGFSEKKVWSDFYKLGYYF